MPTYSYFCPACEKKFDAFHSMKCTDPQLCPTCGTAGKKLLSASSIIFKGSGFYTTDYRSSGYVEAQNRDKDTSTPAAPKSDGGSGGASSGAGTAKTADSSAPSASSGDASSPSSTAGGKEQACAA
ncbi:MAG TPA: zinc ribbon domain-containing protein [Candidatus Ozemobacteraceae bacterium]|nr:zinc ribbon domain-containing protein [Candidatus Ozemobacteraceae bacterium]HQG30135.1 zinc ribbon domain-containing protein [Candidatus Ozemobacteraceae bacterium]